MVISDLPRPCPVRRIGTALSSVAPALGRRSGAGPRSSGIHFPLQALRLRARDIRVAAIDATDAGALVDVQSATEALGVENTSFAGHLLADRSTAMRTPQYGGESHFGVVRTQNAVERSQHDGTKVKGGSEAIMWRTLSFNKLH